MKWGRRIKMSRIKFEYENEFGDVVKTEETFNEDVLQGVGENTFNYIVEGFKTFLKHAQFSEDSVDKIKDCDEDI